MQTEDEDENMTLHGIMSKFAAALGGRLLSTLPITRLILTGSEIDDAGVAALVLGLRSCPFLHVRAPCRPQV